MEGKKHGQNGDLCSFITYVIINIHDWLQYVGTKWKQLKSSLIRNKKANQADNFSRVFFSLSIEVCDADLHTEIHSHDLFRATNQTYYDSSWREMCENELEKMIHFQWVPNLSVGYPTKPYYNLLKTDYHFAVTHNPRQKIGRKKSFCLDHTHRNGSTDFVPSFFSQFSSKRNVINGWSHDWIFSRLKNKTSAYSTENANRHWLENCSSHLYHSYLLAEN